MQCICVLARCRSVFLRRGGIFVLSGGERKQRGAGWLLLVKLWRKKGGKGNVANVVC